MQQLDIKFVVRRLLSMPCGHELYRLEAEGDLSLAYMPRHPVRVALISTEEAENRQRSQFRLAMDTPDGPVEEVVEIPAAEGDCWTVMLQLKASKMSPLLTRYINPFLGRARKILKAHSEQKRSLPGGLRLPLTAHAPRALLSRNSQSLA
jgi:hypothetical protein